MKDLADLQKSFQDFLLKGKSDIEQYILGSEKVSVALRLNIYSHAYRARLHDVLISNYPVLHAYLGDHDFDEMSYAYIDAYPSTYASIRWFGHQLSHFLHHHQEYARLPYLADIAEWEWMMALVFDAPDAPSLSIEAMSNIPPESWTSMRLVAHPSLHRVNLTWNAVSIWQHCSEGSMSAQPAGNSQQIAWVCWRQQLTTRFTSLTEDEAWAIDAVLKGLTFGEIGEGLCQWVEAEAAGLHAASLLKGWIQSGLLTEVIY